MLIFRGFAPHAVLINNTPGVVNPVGELSTRSSTYAKEKGRYGNTAIDPQLSLISFLSERDGVQITMPVELRDVVLNVLKATYDYSFSQAGRMLDVGDFTNLLYTQFNSVIKELKVGAIEDDGMYWLPARLSFQVRDMEENRVDIWLADGAFQNQFPETIIEVIAPFDNLDDFFLAGEIVEDRLRAITPSDTATRIQTARGIYPETFMRIDLFNYHDPANSTRVVPSSWGILVYGIVGNNIDSIKEAIITYILENSSRTREEWAVIFPEIFRKYEFVIAPFWDKYAIPNKITQAGIYSPILSLTEILDHGLASAPDYDPEHVKQHITVMGYPYRSLAVASIGHMENRDGTHRIEQLYPDWINTNTTQDFNRMNEATRHWAITLSEAIMHAEVYADYDNIPTGFMKVIREGLLYLTFTINGINYLVLCKSNFL